MSRDRPDVKDGCAVIYKVVGGGEQVAIVVRRDDGTVNELRLADGSRMFEVTFDRIGPALVVPTPREVRFVLWQRTLEELVVAVGTPVGPFSDRLTRAVASARTLLTADPVRSADIFAERIATADESYGVQALASAIGEWSCLLRDAEEQVGALFAGEPEPQRLSMARVCLRAIASAMRHTAEAARMVQASRPSCKRTETDRG